jgi:uncharacterized surface protein with fasciclin (FAS1) repeats
MHMASIRFLRLPTRQCTPLRRSGQVVARRFSTDTLKKIAYDHIIKGYIVKTENFVDGLMPFLTMSDRFIATESRPENNGLVYYINEKSAIIFRDIIVSNGVIHAINHVVQPSELNIVQSINKDPKFSLFNEALLKTGLWKELLLTRDESYDPDDYGYIDVTFIQGGGSKDELPVSRKYGYTVLMESNDTYKNLYGIETLEQLSAYAAANVYHENPDDANVTDITDRRNSLNKFIAYHLINKKLTYSKFIDDYDTDHMIKTYDMYEYIETMCPNTLIEVKKERATGESNLLNKSVETGEAVRINKNYKDIDATNGVYHEIDRILIYNKQVAGELSSKRLRMDAASFFP